MTRIAAILSILAALHIASPAHADASSVVAPAHADAPLRYVSQRTEKAYLREGPTYAHRVLWVYGHKGYPFAVIAEFDVWRRVQAADGTTGWMAASMLTDQRTVLVTGKGRAQIFARPEGGKVVALADPGAVVSLKSCTLNACQIKGAGVDGWIAKDRMWGAGKNEVFAK
jgi:SH3-like domain-containing protein